MDMDTPKAAAAAVEAAAVPAVAVEAAAAGLVGQRCDQALAALLPHLGLRGRRRCLERGGALCNGCPVSAAHRLVSGDVLTLVSPVAALSAAQALAAAGARLLSRQGDYAFFFKPAGLHTAALAGDAGPSLEGLLPALTAELPAPEVGAARPDPSAVSPFCRLLQRLDRETSGLVCAALRPEAVQAFRRAEARGLCDERYVALLQGRLAAPTTAREALDTADRRRSRVLPGSVDLEHTTEFFPLCYWPPDRVFALTAAFFVPGVGGRTAPPAAGGLTLAACRIRRGARHQIRAHAAALGHPLWGDRLYGGLGEGIFWLHHGGLGLPGADCTLPPPWPLPPRAAAAAAGWCDAKKDFFHPPATAEVF